MNLEWQQRTKKGETEETLNTQGGVTLIVLLLPISYVCIYFALAFFYHDLNAYRSFCRDEPN
jgi:hypothetical protein